MSKVLILFASMSGNTEEIADLIEASLVHKGVEVDKMDVTTCDHTVFFEYETIILGAFTWGNGELPDDFEDIYDEMGKMDLEGKNFAVFGSGDTAYEHFCAAVDILEEKVKEQGGNLLLEGLKIELAPYGEDSDRCSDFGKQIAELIK